MNQDGEISVPKSPSGVRVCAAPPIALLRPEGAKDTDFVFSMEYGAIRWNLNRCLDLAGIDVGDGWCTHGLRRTHATLMKQAGAKALAEQMGHASEGMSVAYVREHFGEHVAAVNRIFEMVERVQ